MRDDQSYTEEAGMLREWATEHRGFTDQPAQIIRREQRWFDAHDGDVACPTHPQILASRWTGDARCPFEHESEIDTDCPVLGIALRPIQDLTIFAAGKAIHSGQLPRGSMRVNEPGVRMRGIFLGAYDVLHLHVPNTMIAEYAGVACGRTRGCPLIVDHPIVDPVIERLGCALIHAEELGGALGQSYAEGISLAITAHLCGGHSASRSTTGHRVSSLSKWRLKRATDFMEANLAETIGLIEIAAAAGLSRMHFAAQFRVATGLRPHEYLQRRRIERARELISTTRLPLVQIALEVGFKTQAHFTSIFSGLVGETPNVWRQRNASVARDLPMAACVTPRNITVFPSAERARRWVA
jgi:AraC family transcriptional regulator